MERTCVVSSNISEVGHEGDTLYLRFNSGCCYSYSGVSFSVYQSMIKSESCGKFFHQFIKGKYHYVKLNHDPFIPKAA